MDVAQCEDWRKYFSSPTIFHKYLFFLLYTVGLIIDHR